MDGPPATFYRDISCGDDVLSCNRRLMGGDVPYMSQKLLRNHIATDMANWCVGQARVWFISWPGR